MLNKNYIGFESVDVVRDTTDGVAGYLRRSEFHKYKSIESTLNRISNLNQPKSINNSKFQTSQTSYNRLLIMTSVVGPDFTISMPTSTSPHNNCRIRRLQQKHEIYEIIFTGALCEVCVLF
jgi:hypothetical protein